MDIGERYRPDTLERVAGQARAVAQVKRVLERGGWAGQCWWLYGASGTGKTTIARIIAHMQAGEHSIREYVGRDMSIDDCRAMMDSVPLSSMFGGRAWIINEAQDLSEACLGLLLEIAEMVKKSRIDCLIFTSMTEPSLLDSKGAKYHALMGRCHRPEMAQTTDENFRAGVVEYVFGVAVEEDIPATMAQIYRTCEVERWSVRAVLSRLEMGLEDEPVQVAQAPAPAPKAKPVKASAKDIKPAAVGMIWQGRPVEVVKARLPENEARKLAQELGDKAAIWYAKKRGTWTVARFVA